MLKTHRIHFDVAQNKEAVREAWCDFLVCCVDHKLLPAKMYKTGRSRRDAMKRSVDLLDSKSLNEFILKTQTIRGLPDYYIGSLWAEKGEREQDYNIQFFSNPRSFKMPYMLFLETTEDEEPTLRKVLEFLWIEKKIYCIDIVLGLRGCTPIEAYDSTGAGGAEAERSLIYQSLINLAIFNQDPHEPTTGEFRERILNSIRTFFVK